MTPAPRMKRGGRFAWCGLSPGREPTREPHGCLPLARAGIISVPTHRGRCVYGWSQVHPQGVCPHERTARIAGIGWSGDFDRTCSPLHHRGLRRARMRITPHQPAPGGFERTGYRSRTQIPEIRRIDAGEGSLPRSEWKGVATSVAAATRRAPAAYTQFRGGRYAT